jgi:hypothetical protein
VDEVLKFVKEGQLPPFTGYMPVIKLSDGSYFNFDCPEKSTVTIQAIAHALSQLCRYTGHTTEMYSVAQHSVHVSEIVPPEYALQGLMHDAPESLMADLSSPLKYKCPDYRALEKKIEPKLMAQFDVDYPFDPSIKRADLVMLKTERRDLLPPDMPHEDIGAWNFLDSIPELPQKIIPWPSYLARKIFLARFMQLTKYA